MASDTRDAPLPALAPVLATSARGLRFTGEWVIQPKSVTASVPEMHGLAGPLPGGPPS